jgi:multicomponent Na+:H+ antiporter subunit E
MRYGIILAFFLTLYWLGLSGHYTPLIMTLGALSVLTVVWLTRRMKILDEETVPYLHVPKTMSYYSWLFKEIVKANVAVVRSVLSPDLEVSPKMVTVPAKQGTDLARTMFANSITLTPGTVSVDMVGDKILVHALLADMSDPKGFAEMSERSAWSVGEDLPAPTPRKTRKKKAGA